MQLPPPLPPPSITHTHCHSLIGMRQGRRMYHGLVWMRSSFSQMYASAVPKMAYAMNWWMIIRMAMAYLAWEGGLYTHGGT